MSNLLEQLKTMTTVVADTGEFAAIERYTPKDATTNPSLILKAAQQPEYRHLLEEAHTWVLRQNLNKTTALNLMADKLAVSFGEQILKVIPGRISTEVDSRLSFDTHATVERARGLIHLYKEQRDAMLLGIDFLRYLQFYRNLYKNTNHAHQILECHNPTVYTNR